LETIEKSIKGIAENLAANGVTDDELHRSLKPVLTSIRDMRKTNTYWLNSVMTGSKSHPERFDWCRSFLKSYSEISKKDMDAYAAEYFVNDNASVIKVMPEMSE
jgi:zinc protease